MSFLFSGLLDTEGREHVAAIELYHILGFSGLSLIKIEA
jgi:hypothetical protein